MDFKAVKDLKFACGTPVTGHDGPVWVDGRDDVPRVWEVVIKNGSLESLRVEDDGEVDGWCTPHLTQCYADRNAFLHSQLDYQYSEVHEWWDKIYVNPKTPCMACRATWELGEDGKHHVILEDKNDRFVVDVRLKIAVAESAEHANLICDVINNAMHQYETFGANKCANSLMKTVMDQARSPAGKEVPHEVSTPPA